MIQYSSYKPYLRKGGRAVNCNGLENRDLRGPVGSNPSPSAHTEITQLRNFFVNGLDECSLSCRQVRV